MKRCKASCHEGDAWLPATLQYFCVKPDMLDKLHPYCRTCANRLFREKYRAKHAIYQKQYVADRKMPMIVGSGQIVYEHQMPPLDEALFDIPEVDEEMGIDTFIEFEDDMSDDVGQ